MISVRLHVDSGHIGITLGMYARLYCVLQSVKDLMPQHYNRCVLYVNSSVNGRLESLWGSHMGTRGFHEEARSTATELKDVVKKDLLKMGISWDEVEEAAEDRRSWRNRVAQCIFDAG